MLLRAAEDLERHDDLAAFWRDLVRVLAREGVSHVIYLTVDRDFDAPLSRSTLNDLYRDLPVEQDPFLVHCCSGYDATRTGAAFQRDYEGLRPEERAFIKGAAKQGFVSGMAIPMRLRGSGRFGGFNLGTPLDRAAFETEIWPRVEEFRAFCLLMHRRIEELSEPCAPHGDTFHISRISTDLQDRLSGLSPREREVVYLLAQGISRKETAHLCGISVNTVSEYAKGAYAKLGVHNSTQVARLVFSNAAE